MEGCNHKFEVEWSKFSETHDTLTQILKCKICKRRFFGMGGKPKEPTIIHEMHEASASFLDNY